MTAQVSVTEPAPGGVLIDLDWDTASALARVLGNVNTGDSDKTGLSRIYDVLEPHFGNERNPRGKWRGTNVRHGQIYIHENSDADW